MSLSLHLTSSYLSSLPRKITLRRSASSRGRCNKRLGLNVLAVERRHVESGHGQMKEEHLMVQSQFWCLIHAFCVYLVAIHSSPSLRRASDFVATFGGTSAPMPGGQDVRTWLVILILWEGLAWWASHDTKILKNLKNLKNINTWGTPLQSYTGHRRAKLGICAAQPWRLTLWKTAGCRGVSWVPTLFSGQLST